MGWVWKDDDDDDDRNSGEINEFQGLNSGSEAGSSTRKIISSECRTEEVEPGKFIRKCEKTEQLLREFVGRPSEVVQSNKEYTEEDVTEQMKNGSSLSSELAAAFDLPGLRSDIEEIERSLFGNMNRFFEAAEGLFGIFGSPHVHKGDSKSIFGSPPSDRYDLPRQPEVRPRSPKKEGKSDAGDGLVDLSGLARDV